jgi:uncharacterized protein YecE (DUF72 family)
LVDWYLGTAGFSYKAWDGVFYPTGTSPGSYLAYYSQVFNSVEIDSTFYGIPPADRVRQWAMTVPAEFKFCPKTPRQITHELRLVKATQLMLDFLETVALFGEKLGTILIQLPPSLTNAQIDVVNSFLTALPSDFQYAVEFRHASWFSPDTAVLLEAHHICWVSTDYIDLPRQIVRTSNVLYLRWLGQHGRFEHKNREQRDVTSELEWWKDQLQPHLAQLQSIYGFFNNDYAGYSPATCNQFKHIMGLPARSAQVPSQGKLF